MSDYFECRLCGRVVKPVRAVGADDLHWPAGRACSRCDRGEMVYRPGSRVEEDIFAEEAADRLGLKIECPPDEPVTGMRIMAAMEAEIARLRIAIRRLADQDATLSVCNGNVTVTMDATLTPEEREAVAYYIGTGGPDAADATLRALLERLK